MAKRRNPDEEKEEGGGNPLIIVGVVAVLGIGAFLMLKKKPRRTAFAPGSVPGQAPGSVPGQAPGGVPGQLPGQQPTGTAAGIAAILGPLAQAGSQMYGAHTNAQVQQARIRGR